VLPKPQQPFQSEDRARLQKFEAGHDRTHQSCVWRPQRPDRSDWWSGRTAVL